MTTAHARATSASARTPRARRARARVRSVNRLAGEMATGAVTGAMRIHACEGRSVRLGKMTTTTMTVRGGRGERAGSSARRTPSVVTRAVKRVFIDGEAGTTGLQVRERLQARSDIELIQLDESKRKDLDARKKALNECDAAILCLPDAAAIEAVKLVENDTTVVIDASTAFRVADGWTYGFPELAPGHRDKVKTSKRISNPGCYPTGFIALTRPLVDAGILSPDTALTVNAVSGYRAEVKLSSKCTKRKSTSLGELTVSTSIISTCRRWQSGACSVANQSSCRRSDLSRKAWS